MLIWISEVVFSQGLVKSCLLSGRVGIEEEEEEEEDFQYKLFTVCSLNNSNQQFCPLWALIWQAKYHCLFCEHNHLIAKRVNTIEYHLSSTGIHIAKRIDKMGMKSSDTAQIFFEDVVVPQDYIIGEEGMGFTYQMIQFQAERMWAAAASKYDKQQELDYIYNKNTSSICTYYTVNFCY